MANPLESLAVELVANVQGFVKDANTAIDKVEKNANESFGKIEKKATGAFGNVGKAIMGAVGGAVIGGTLGALGQKFAKLDETMAGVAARAGLTAEQQDKLTDSTIQLSKANLQSQEDIALTGEALISLQGVEADNQEQIEKLTQQYLDYALVTGQTAPDAVAAFDDILDAWNLTAEDGIAIMDALVVSHQKFGTDIVGAQGALNKYASTFQTLGLDVNDAVGYINLFAASGVDAESASTAFTKAVGLLTDGTDASNKKLAQMADNLGLTVDEVDAFAKADPAGKFDILTKAIAATEDPTLRAQAAIDLFGAKAGPKMAEALAGNGIEDFKINLDLAAEATEVAADKIQGQLINKLKLLGKEVTGRAMELTQDFAPALMLIGTVGPQAAAGVSGLAGAFLPLLANPIVLGIAAIVAALVLLELKTHVLSETVLPALKQAFIDILPHLKDAAEWVQDKLIPALQRLGRDVLDQYVIPALISLKQGWADLKPLLKDAADRFVNDILPALITVGKALSETLLPPLRDVGKFIVEHKPLLIALGLALTALVAPWLAVAAAIVIVLAHWDDIRAFFEGVTLKVQELIEKISEIPIIGEIVQAAFDSLVVIVTAAFETIKEIVQGQIDLVIGIFKIAMALLQGDFGEAWEEIKKLFSNQLGHLKDIIGIGLDLIRDLIWIAVQGFAGVVSDGAILFVEAGIKLVQALYDGADGFITDTLLPFFKGLPQNILDAIGDLSRWLWDKGQELFEGLKLAVVDARDKKIIPFFKELPGKITDTLIDLPSELANVGVGAMNALIGVIEGGINLVVDAIRLLFEGIKAAADAFPGPNPLGNAMQSAIDGISNVTLGSIPKLKSETEQLGRDLSLGLKKGIDDNAADVYAAARALGFNSAAAVRNSLDATSPSKVMMAIGSDVSLGLAMGIQQGVGGVQSAIGGIASTVIGGMQGVAGVVKGTATTLGNAWVDAYGKTIGQGAAVIGSAMQGVAGIVAGAVSTIGSGMQGVAGVVLGVGKAADYTIAQYDLLASSLEGAKNKQLDSTDAMYLAQAGFRDLADAVIDYTLGLITAEELTAKIGETFTEVATSAAVLGAQWTTAFADAMQRQDLLEAVGSAGVRVLDQLNLVLTEGGQKNVETLAGLVTSMLAELESDLPADEAEALGERITSALEEALRDGTPEAIKAFTDLLYQANDAMEAGTTTILTTVGKFNVKLGDKFADKALEDRVGRNGANLMDALDLAIKTGGAKGTDTMAQEAFDIINAMQDKLSPGQAEMLGQTLMGALQSALETGGDGAIAAVMAILAQIQALIDGAPTTIPIPEPARTGANPRPNDGGHGTPTPAPTPAPAPSTGGGGGNIKQQAYYALGWYGPPAALRIAQLVNSIMAKFASWAAFIAATKLNPSDDTKLHRKLVDGFGLPSSFDEGGLLMPGLTFAWNGTGVPEQVIAPGAGGNSTRSTNYGKQYFIYGPGRQSKDVIRDLDRLLA